MNSHYKSQEYGPVRGSQGVGGPPMPNRISYQAYKDQSLKRKLSQGVEDVHRSLGRYRLGSACSPTFEIYVIAGVNLVISFIILILLYFGEIKNTYKMFNSFSTEDISVNDIHALRSYAVTYVAMHCYSSVMLLAVALSESYDACSFWIAIAFIELIVIIIFSWMTTYHVSLVIGMLWLVTILLILQTTMSLFNYMGTLGPTSPLSVRYHGNIGLVDPYNKEQFIDMYDILRGGTARKSLRESRGGHHNDHYNVYYEPIPPPPAQDANNTIVIDETKKNQQDMQIQAHPSNFPQEKPPPKKEQPQPDVDLNQNLEQPQKKKHKKHHKHHHHKHHHRSHKKDKENSNEVEGPKEISKPNKKEAEMATAVGEPAGVDSTVLPKPPNDDTKSEMSEVPETETAAEGKKKKKKKKKRKTDKGKQLEVSNKPEESMSATNNNTPPDPEGKDKVRDTTKDGKKKKKKTRDGSVKKGTFNEFVQARRNSNMHKQTFDR